MALGSVSFPKLLWENIVEKFLEWRMYAWKKKAVKRGMKNRDLRKKVARIEQRRLGLQTKFEALQEEHAQVKKSLEMFS